MATPFLGEIRMFAFGFPPRGWALCNGQFLPINQNQALFSILGTTYGGNGQTTFALPDLRGRTPVSFGPSFTLGQRAGEEAHTLTLSEMPQHTHFVQAGNSAANAPAPTGNFFAQNAKAYAGNGNVSMAPETITNTGGSQPHANMSPFLVVSFAIALNGTFPSRN